MGRLQLMCNRGVVLIIEFDKFLLYVRTNSGKRDRQRGVCLFSIFLRY